MRSLTVAELDFVVGGDNSLLPPALQTQNSIDKGGNIGKVIGDILGGCAKAIGEGVQAIEHGAATIINSVSNANTANNASTTCGSSGVQSVQTSSGPNGTGSTTVVCKP